MEASDVPQSSSPEMVEMAEENCSVAEVTEISAGHEQSSLSSPSAGENEEKHLPADFERLWLATHENPSDFTSWTDLLQYCEQEVGDTRDKSFKTNTREQCFFLVVTPSMCINDLLQGQVTASRRALEAFLTRYPLCYGYWKKITDLERRAGDNAKAEEVKQLNPSGLFALVNCVCAKSLVCVLGVCPRSQSNPA